MLKKRFYPIMTFWLLCWSCDPAYDKKGIKLEFLWETDSILTTAESVIYDSLNDVIFVSCINGLPSTAKDNDGFIAMVGLDSGKILDLLYIPEVNAPKGMSIWGDLMYATDVDEVVMISLDDAIPIFRNTIDHSEFLNDILLGPTSKLYISDTEKDPIFVMNSDSITRIIKLDSAAGPNGLLMRDKKLLWTGFKNGTLNELDLETGKSNLMADSLGMADGIAIYNGKILVSDWNGALYHVKENGEIISLLELEYGINAAGIFVIAEKDLLLIPTFSSNTVRAYRISGT